MGASFQIVTLAKDDKGRPLWVSPLPDTEALPWDGGSWAYSSVASVLQAFGLAFDEDYCADILDPQVLVDERDMALLRATCSDWDDLVVYERVQLLADMAEKALAIPGAMVSYS